MWRLKLVPAKTNIPFTRFRLVAFAFSTFMVVASSLLAVFHGLNFGVDFRGGIVIEIRTSGPADIARMRSTLSDLELEGIELQGFANADEVLIRLPVREGGQVGQSAAVEKIRTALGTGIEFRRIEFVGPNVSDELFWGGVYAVTAALLAIMVYVWFRFEWQFGVCGVAALVHDVITTVGMVALFDVEFNLTMVAAILTIAGYSINDTVVIFDRVRENMRRYKTLPFAELLDLSNNETLSRTAMTAGTVFLSVMALFLFGGDVIRGFSFAMLWGVVVGSYSTVFIAVPLLLYLDVDRGALLRESKEGAPEQAS